MRLFSRSGVWYIEFERGVKRSLKTRDEGMAKEIYKDIEKKILRGRLVQLDKGKRISLAEFRDIFFKRHCDIASWTVKKYEVSIRQFMDSVGSATLLPRIDEKSIAKFKTDCRARGVKEVSLRSYLRHIKGFFNRAYDWGYLAKKVNVKIAKGEKRHPRILNQDEIDLLLLHSKYCDFEMHRIIRFALNTGARREEIKTFTWQRVDGSRGTLIGKGNKERTIPLLSGALKAMGPARDIGPVFLQVHLDTYTHRFKELARDCEIEDISFHKLRHTAATNMLRAGMGIKYVKEFLGHENLATTEIYAQVLQNDLMREAEKFNGFTG
jgi:site-specific recombinase XerD